MASEGAVEVSPLGHRYALRASAGTDGPPVQQHDSSYHQQQRASGAGHPEDRLYSTREDFFRRMDEQRVAQEQARLDAELEGTTFRPVISHRSRAIAQREASRSTPATERLYQEAEARRPHRDRSADASKDLSANRSAADSFADRDVSSTRSASRADTSQSTLRPGATDDSDNLPRVARDYHAASIEHEWYIEHLRAEQRDRESASHEPALSRPPPSRSEPPSIALPAPTRADDFRAAAAAKRASSYNRSQQNPLESDAYRQRREAMLERAKEREAKAREEAAVAAVAQTKAAEARQAASRKAAKDIASAVDRLYSDGASRAERRAAAEAEEREKAAAKRREQRRQHETAYEQAKADHAAELERAVAAAGSTGHEDTEQTTEEPAADEQERQQKGPAEAAVAHSSEQRKTTARPVADSAVNSALRRRRREEAAERAKAAGEAMRERRHKAEALRLARAQEAQAIAERGLQLPSRSHQKPAARSSSSSGAPRTMAKAPEVKPQQRAAAKTRDTPAELMNTTVDSFVADGVPTSAAKRTQPQDASSAPQHRLPDAQETADGAPVKGMDAFLRRKARAEQLKREAAAKLRVKTTAVHRVRDENGRLVTHCDPFRSLEAHEQRSYDRRQKMLEELRAAEGPFTPVTSNSYYYATASPSKDAEEAPASHQH